MSVTRITGVVFLFFIIAYGCEKDKDRENGSGCFQVDHNDDTEYQLTRKWEFLGFYNTTTKDERCKPGHLNRMSIEFSDSNRFHAVSSCNTFEGYYSVTPPSAINLDSIGTTLIYCLDETVREWERDYLDELKVAGNFQIIRNLLIITTTTDNNLIFKAEY
jgi:heat shock protein HslJ